MTFYIPESLTLHTQRCNLSIVLFQNSLKGSLIDTGLLARQHAIMIGKYLKINPTNQVLPRMVVATYAMIPSLFPSASYRLHRKFLFLKLAYIFPQDIPVFLAYVFESFVKSLLCSMVTRRTCTVCFQANGCVLHPGKLKD